MRRHHLAIALSGLMLLACGDDGDGGAAATDSSVSNVGSDSGRSPADAAVPSDASAAADAGDSGSRVDAAVGPGIDAGQRADAGVRDGAAPVDAARDSSTGATSDAAVADGGGMASTACLSCLNTFCVCDATCQSEALGAELPAARLSEACSKFPGDARTGPAAGAPLSELCTELVECERSTGCARENDTIGCLCGDLETAMCEGDPMADPNGPCVDEIYRAAESEMRADVFTNIKNPLSAAGAAYQLLTCEIAKCADECFAPCAGKPDGTQCGVDPAPPNAPLLCRGGKCPDTSHALDGWLPTGSGPMPDAGSGTVDAGSGTRDAAVDAAARDAAADAAVDAGGPAPGPDAGCPNGMTFC